MKEYGKFTKFVETHIGFDGTIGLEHVLSSCTTLARDANPRLHDEENSIKPVDREPKLGRNILKMAMDEDQRSERTHCF